MMLTVQIACVKGVAHCAARCPGPPFCKHLSESSETVSSFLFPCLFPLSAPCFRFLSYLCPCMYVYRVTFPSLSFPLPPFQAASTSMGAEPTDADTWKMSASEVVHHGLFRCTRILLEAHRAQALILDRCFCIVQHDRDLGVIRKRILRLLLVVQDITVPIGLGVLALIVQETGLLDLGESSNGSRLRGNPVQLHQLLRTLESTRSCPPTKASGGRPRTQRNWDPLQR